MEKAKKKITVSIDKLGVPTVEAHNFTGNECEKVTAPIENALAGGADTFSREIKPEWYEQEQTQVHEEN